MNISNAKYDWNLPGVRKEKANVEFLKDNTNRDINVFIMPITFECANVPVEVAAKALGTDKQTLRIMLQQKIVDWGIAYKLPNSTQYIYLISPKKFYEATGFAYRPKE